MSELMESERLSYKFLSKNFTRSDYDWVNVYLDGEIVGKIRSHIESESLTIYSINIFPEYERNGYAREAVEFFMKKFKRIIADRVRYTAIGFWSKLEFEDQGDGNYIWKSS